MSNQPKVSVIMPSLNVAEYIRECVESVLNQSLKDIEIICVDSGSTDGTLDILREYAGKDKRVKLIQTEQRSYGHQMNLGLDAAQGDYIGIVETDDSIAENMYEELLKLSKSETVDVVKGNFWHCFTEGTRYTKYVNLDRRKMNGIQRSFTINERPQLLAGHPSVWSAIYRRAFLTENNIRFVEAKGAGWVDNPFFYETLLAAKSIIWTDTPYYCYRKTNPNSSSNRQTDLTVPFKRMLEILDVIEKYGYQNEAILKRAYTRGISYIYGVEKQKYYAAQQASIRKYAREMLLRFKENLVLDNLSDRAIATYYKYVSPVDDAVPEKKKILLYHWLPFDDAQAESGVGRYLRELTETILQTRPDVELYYLSSGHAYDASNTVCYYDATKNPYWDRCRTFEIVNSPVPAPRSESSGAPQLALENSALSAVFSTFLKENGPFEAIHFHSIEGLSLDCLNLKAQFPATKIVCTLHDYAPFCAQGDFFDRKKHCSCPPSHKERDCRKCTACTRTPHIARELYERAERGNTGKFPMPEKKWIEEMGFSVLDKKPAAGALTATAKRAAEALSREMDVILADSARAREIAVACGLDAGKTRVSHRAARAADYAAHPAKEGLGGGTLKLVYPGGDLDAEETGYRFLLDALAKLPPETAGKINLLLTAAKGQEEEIRAQLDGFHSLTVKEDALPEQVKFLLGSADLGVVPVLWEECLPQMALEMRAWDLPILYSSCGGTAELCGAPEFQFAAGSEEDFINRLTALVEAPEKLKEFRSSAKPLTTMGEQRHELEKIYGIEGRPESVTMTFEDFSRLQSENLFLRRKVLEAETEEQPASLGNKLKKLKWKTVSFYKSNGLKNTASKIAEKIAARVSGKSTFSGSGEG